MNTIPTSSNNQATKPSSGKQGDKNARPPSDDRHEVGLIAAIMVVLALGVLGYWIVEEGENQQSGTTTVAAIGVTEDWEKSHTAESNESGSAASLVQTVSAETGDMSSTAQTSIPTQVDMDVHFDFNQHRLTDETQSLVKEEVARRGEHGGWSVSIEGHADQLGSETYNQALGLQRAKSIKQFLVELGVPGDAIRISSMGERAPLCLEKNDDCYHTNRRAHVLWSKPILVTQTPSLPIPSAQPQRDQVMKLATVSPGELKSDQGVFSTLDPVETP